MNSNAFRSWALTHAAITSVLIIVSWIFVAVFSIVMGPMIDRFDPPKIVGIFQGILGMGLLFFIPAFWSYRLISKTARHLAANSDPETSREV